MKIPTLLSILLLSVCLCSCTNKDTPHASLPTLKYDIFLPREQDIARRELQEVNDEFTLVERNRCAPLSSISAQKSWSLSRRNAEFYSVMAVAVLGMLLGGCIICSRSAQFYEKHNLKILKENWRLKEQLFNLQGTYDEQLTMSMRSHRLDECQCKEEHAAYHEYCDKYHYDLISGMLKQDHLSSIKDYQVALRVLIDWSITKRETGEFYQAAIFVGECKNILHKVGNHFNSFLNDTSVPSFEKESGHKFQDDIDLLFSAE